MEDRSLSGNFPDNIRLNAVLCFYPVLLITAPDQAEDLIEEADNRVREESADHHGNCPEPETDSVINPVRVIEQEEITV